MEHNLLTPIGTRNINFVDETLDSFDNLDVNGMEKVEHSVDENSLANLNNLKETINELASNEIKHSISKENMYQEDDINIVSPEIVVSMNLSRPPDFEYMQRTSSKWFTSFSRYQKKDIKGVSLIEELSEIIETRWPKLFYGIELVILCINTIFGDMNVVRNENKRSGSLFSQHDANNFNSLIDNSGLIDLPLGGRLFTWMNKARTKLSKLDRFLISEEVVEALLDDRVTAIDRFWSGHNRILFMSLNPTLVLLLSSFSILEKIDAGSANDDDRDSHIKFLQEVDILDTFESFDLFLKACIKWDIEGDENSKFFHALIKQKRRAQMIHGIIKESVRIFDPCQIMEEFLNFFKEKFKNHDSNVDFPPFAHSSGLCALDCDSLETLVSLDEVNNADYIKVDILEYVNTFFDTGSFPQGSNSSFFTLIPKIRACLSSSRASVLINGSLTLKLSIKRGLKQGDPLLPFLFVLVMEGLHNALSIADSLGLIRGVNFGFPEITISHRFDADDVVIITEWNANDLENIIRLLHVFYLASGLKLTFRNLMFMALGFRMSMSLPWPEIWMRLRSFPFTYLVLPISSNMSLTSSWQVLLESFQSKLSLGKANLLSIGLKAFNLSLLQSSVRGCYRTRTRSGLKLSKLYMVRKVALITMVASITVLLINGSLTLKLSIKRGLKQGDPLLPFLFVPVMEGLHNALSIADSSGLIRGVNFGFPEITISYRFDADDVVIITKWNANDLENIIRLLHVFYLASGLKLTFRNLMFMALGFRMSMSLPWPEIWMRFKIISFYLSCVTH
nr:RNA-directed DNA polymerase, eukaryota, reverse transcriptase zinc-binding domain protein [Tanacetum cinerariifolium]